MSNGFTIHFLGPAAEEVSRARNFAEELSRELERSSIGSTSDPDVVTITFQVEAVSPRHLGEVKRLIDAQVKKHLLQTEVRIERA